MLKFSYCMIVMAALRSRCGHSILPLWFLLSFFLACFQPSWIGCLPYFHTWYGLSTNLECRSTLSGYMFTAKACIDNWKKNLLNGNTSSTIHMSSQYSELQPTNGWDQFISLGHPSKFQQVSPLGVITAQTLVTGGQPNFAWCLAISCAGTLYIHFHGLMPPDRMLPGAKFTLRPSLSFSYIGSIRCPSCHTHKCQSTKGKMKALTPTGGLSSSFLHPALNSREPGSVTPVSYIFLMSRHVKAHNENTHIKVVHHSIYKAVLWQSN